MKHIFMLAEKDFTTEPRYPGLWKYYLELYEKKINSLEDLIQSTPEPPIFILDPYNNDDFEDELGDEGMINLDNIQEG